MSILLRSVVLISGLLCLSTHARTQDFRLRILDYNTAVDNVLKIPFLESDSFPDIAAKINEHWQRQYFDEPFDTISYREVLKEITPTEDQFMGLNLLEIDTLLLSDRYLYFRIFQEYLGAYPHYSEDDHWYDLQTGEPIRPSSLFQDSSYFDFLEVHWLPECFESLKEAHECGQGEATIKGYCYHRCFSFDQFFPRGDSLQLSCTSCYPHVTRACNPYVKKDFSIFTLEPYFNTYGKYLFGLTDSISSPPSLIYLVGSINERYDIYMTLHIPKSEGDSLSGVYTYQKVGRPIQLQSVGGQQGWSMDEFTEGKHTGTFELEATDFEQIYPGMEIRGKWVHPEKKRKYPVLLEVVFKP